MTPYQFQEWIFDRCCHNGEIELTKEQLGICFPGKGIEEFANIQKFLEEKGISVYVDTKKKTFKFVLGESESDSGNIVVSN